MRIIDQSYDIRTDINPDILHQIEQAGRTCYKSEDHVDGTIEGAAKFVKMLIDRGHHAMLEHGPAISVKFVCDRGVCYSEDTDVLTDEGWKPWPEIRGDEKFATLDPKTHALVYQDAEEVIREEYEGPMYLLQSSMINLCVTPKHKAYIQKHDTQAARRKEEPWQLIPVHEIAGKRVSYKRDAVPFEFGVSTISIPDFETEQGSRWGGTQPHTRKGKQYAAIPFSRFLGYWISEGSLGHTEGSSYQVELFQNKGPVLDDMLQVLHEMGYDPSVSPNGGSKWNKRVRVSDAALYHWLKPYCGALNKRIPREVLNTFNATSLENLLECYVLGDGSTHKSNGHQQGYTVSRGLADDLQELALKIGISATTWVDDRVGQEGGLGIVHRNPCHVVSFVTGKNTPLVNHGAKTFKGKPHELWVAYSGTVYCVAVPNHTLYVRRNGRPCWSGNSHEIVRHRLFSFAQESTRYCNYAKDRFGSEITVINPRPHMPQEQFEEWQDAVKESERRYFRLVELGAKPQMARSVLPNSLKTEIVVTGNPREWRHFFTMRAAPPAHPQMRELACPLLADFRAIPVLFDDVGDPNCVGKKET